jgi:hypothetical protein
MYKHYSVIDADGRYVTYVLKIDGTIAAYVLKDGEKLIAAGPPEEEEKTRWNGKAWI